MPVQSSLSDQIKPKTQPYGVVDNTKSGNKNNSDLRTLKPEPKKSQQTYDVDDVDTSTSKIDKNGQAIAVAATAVAVGGSIVAGVVKGGVKTFNKLKELGNNDYRCSYVNYNDGDDSISANWGNIEDNSYSQISDEDAAAMRDNLRAANAEAAASAGPGTVSNAMANETSDELKSREKRGYYHIIIDNGHGYDTPGKNGPQGTFYEWKWNRLFSKIFKTVMVDLGFNVHMLVTETSDVGLSARQRRINQICSKYGANNCISISVHGNAAGNGGWKNARGWCVYTSVGQNKSDILATHMCKQVKIENKSMKLIDYMHSQRTVGDGVYEMFDDGDPDCEKNLAMTSDKIRCNSVLTENLFYDNAKDQADLKNGEIFRQLLRIHILGTCHFFDDKNSGKKRIAGKAEYDNVLVTPSDERLNGLLATLNYTTEAPEGQTPERITVADGDISSLVAGKSRNEYNLK